jgi:GTP-binding protein LepA
MVFVGLYPIREDNFTKARESMEKLRLSDSAFTFRPVSSLALGNGFHSGFLGLLHAEIVQERLSREFGLDLLATAPSVEYQITLKSGVDPGKIGVHTIVIPEARSAIRDPDRTSEAQRDSGSEAGMTSNRVFSIQNPSEFPDPSFIEEVREPIMSMTIFSPKRYVGAIMQLCQEKRGAYIDLVYHAGNAEFTYLIPLSEMIVDFFDRLKSVTEGYASLDYEFFEYQPVDVVKVDILVNHEKVDALAFMIVKSEARRRGGEIVKRLAEVLPRQQFSIPIQAAIGGEIIARDDIKPFRKDVIAKLYGGDRTRKDKLLKKQKKGKEKMKLIGRVEIPQNAFFDVLRKK